MILRLPQLQGQEVNHGGEHPQIVRLRVQARPDLQLALPQRVDRRARQRSEQKRDRRHHQPVDRRRDNGRLVLPPVHCRPVVAAQHRHRRVERRGRGLVRKPSDVKHIAPRSAEMLALVLQLNKPND